MATKNVYGQCPVYDTKSFQLRLVRLEDAKALMACYSDKNAVAKINADYCTSAFYYTTLGQMEECIKLWLSEYEKQAYVRFSVIAKTVGHAVGTVEVFGGEFGVMRIDLAASFDKENYIEELLRLAVLHLIRDFQIGSMKIKTSNTQERIPLLIKYGFVLSTTFRPELGYYERPVVTLFNRNKGVAFCGLACCVCSENKACAGCRMEGCKGKAWCKSFRCCKGKVLNGCWECDDFPCEYSMFNKLRIRTFAKYIAQYGAESLMNALQNNEENGFIYHYDGQLIGDYDLLQSEEELYQFIRQGL